MRTEIIGPDGTLRLGDEARAAGFVSGRMVNIVKLSTGNLLIVPVESTPFDTIDIRGLLQEHPLRALPGVDSDKKSE